MKWISVKDSLPVIPEGRYGITVLVCQYDHVFQEISGSGLSVETSSYGYVNYDKMPMFKGSIYPDGSAAFMDWYFGSDGGCLGPTGDIVTHWMYMPEPPDYNEEELNETFLRKENNERSN